MNLSVAVGVNQGQVIESVGTTVYFPNEVMEIPSSRFGQWLLTVAATPLLSLIQTLKLSLPGKLCLHLS